MFYGFWSFLKYFLFSKKYVSKKNKILYDFKKEVLQQKIDNHRAQKIGQLLSFYKNINLDLINEDYGAGARNKKNKSIINTKYLANHVAVSKKYGQVLYALRKYIGAEKVLELGTSLGIGSCYLSASNLRTIEGNTALFEFTKNTLTEYGFPKIDFINARFDDVLPQLISKTNFEMVYIDGNHTYEATTKYFELFLETDKQIVIVFDDIYWTKEMTTAWKHIKSNKKVSLSIDLFKFGIVFVNSKNRTKADYTLWY